MQPRNAGPEKLARTFLLERSPGTRKPTEVGRGFAAFRTDDLADVRNGLVFFSLHRFLLLLDDRGPAGLDRVAEVAGDDADRTDAVVVPGDREVDHVRIRVGVDQGDDLDPEAAGFRDRVLFLA